MSSVDYEKKNNPLLIALGQERFNKGLNSLKDENVRSFFFSSLLLILIYITGMDITSYKYCIRRINY